MASDILIVDDEADIRDLVAGILDDEGFTTRTARDSDSALAEIANLLHLAFNLLALYVFGPEVEERMGGGAFLRYYLLCGLGGAALSLVLGWSFGRLNPVVGASAAVYGVLLAFAWAAPDQ